MAAIMHLGDRYVTLDIKNAKFPENDDILHSGLKWAEADHCQFDLGHNDTIDFKIRLDRVRCTTNTYKVLR